MRKFHVTGMSCAACSSRVEKAVRSLSGVEDCSVSLLTNTLSVQGTVSDESIQEAVQKAGYGASPFETSPGRAAQSAPPEENPAKPLLHRLIWSSVFLLILMYFSMGHMMWGWPLPSFYQDNHIAMGLTQLLLTVIIMVINQRFFISGFRGLIHRSPNMDTLVALGSSAAFLYSTYALFAMTGALVRGDSAAVMRYMMDFYFESAAMILTLITVGKTLEAYSKGKTTDALKHLMDLAPKTACLIQNGQETIVPAEQLQIGDSIAVRPGQNFPADARVIEGTGAVDESALTGESIPVDKKPGDSVSAGTVNRSGFLICQVTKTGSDTALSKIIQMVSDAQSTKAPIAKMADRVSGIFVPTVLILAALTTLIWLLLGRDFGFALARGISVLVISCPCALGLATPVAIMVGSGVGAKNGILFKTAASLEETGRITTVALDKTGTVTLGKPKVTDLDPADGIGEEELLQAAFSLENKSEHPLAGAVIRYAGEKKISPLEIDDFRAVAGNGLSGKMQNVPLYGGNKAFIQQFCSIPDEAQKAEDTFSGEGKTSLFFAKEGHFLGIIAVADTLRPESPEAIARLHRMGLSVVLLTGDRQKTAEAIAGQAGVDRVIAEVLPDGKEAVIRELQKTGKVAMVGDGINDAPALSRADIGIAIGAGTDIAIDAADVVLVKSRLTDVPTAIRLSRHTLRNIRENLFWAFLYNVIGIPIAAGVFSSLGLTLNPMFAAAAMSLSSFCVVTNALRLNFFSAKPADSPGSAELLPSASKNKEEPLMKTTITLNVRGMMCSHCEAAVKKALEAVDGVDEAKVSHEAGTAVVTLSNEVDAAVLKKAVTDAGYTVD